MKRARSPWWFILDIALVAWASVATGLWLSHMTVLMPGSLAEWFTGVVTLLALFAAIWAGFAANGQMQIMQQEARDRAQDSRERQARLVTVSEETARTRDGAAGFALVVHNRSNEPIRDAFVSFVAPKNRNGFHMGTIKPGTSVLVGGSPEIMEQARQAVLASMPEEFHDIIDRLMTFDHAILFTDSKGVKWQRLPDTSLVERAPDFSTDQATQAAAALRFGED